MNIIEDITAQIDAPHAIDSGYQMKCLLAGNATITIKSKVTGNRRTFKVKAKADTEDFYFVSLLTGSNNDDWRSYTYAGLITKNADGLFEFRTTAKSCFAEGSVAHLTLAWTLNKLQTNAAVIDTQVELWHEGRCCCCGRKLTVPESISTGLGPVCASRL
jgi:hypothetical protein